MYSIPSYHELGSSSNSVNFLQGVLSSSTNNQNSSITSSRSTPEEKAAAASKIHSEAERRRRKRINGHLATLRTLLPHAVKTDKASLLAEVVQRLRDLKKTIAELADIGGDSESCLYHMLPSETDELKLCHVEGDPQGALIKATLCCDDRPELISEVTRAVRSVAGTVVRAEMATVGGRIKSVLWIQVKSSGGGEGLGMLRRALKVVVEDSAALWSGPGLGLPENKRACLSHF
ncbi:Transcription factor bHLH30 like [Actinidia chinensis var. chinensis]|uniref:Transcription factor bHLH30 like n=1 Tax=Actinidia chinensis var. chinensis TaxID=1590841 RepID=A0A2R6S321_ACTCC|nr:Transcription factor bHLH30 like [Actinidia chinensis var. chinensis]